MFLAVVFGPLVVFIVYCIVQANTRHGLPRVGNPGFIGYISTALRFSANSEKILQEGWDKFSGRPFILPTLTGPFVILGPKHVELLRKSDDTVFNQPTAINEALQMDHTMNDKLWKNPYHVDVIGIDVTRAISSFVPEVLEETELAIHDEFNPPLDSTPIHIPVFHTLERMIARISNRKILGAELCRNEDYLDAIINFTRSLPGYAQALRCLPRLISPVAYFVLSSILGGQKQPKKLITPYLTRYLLEHENMQERPNNMIDFLIRKSGDEKMDDLAVRVLFVNSASIHTTTIFLTQALFELSILPESDLESIRREVKVALDTEGGWNKAALSKFRMIDSLLREVGRVYGLGSVLMNRIVVRDKELEDGTRIPAGYRARVYAKAAHFNPEIYPNPDVFDAFRFSKLSEHAGSNAQRGFTMVDNNYLAFGIGRHVCPGRFFAAMEIKIMIAYLLLNYDISLPAGVTERPKNIILDAATIPDLKAKLVFRRRCLGATQNNA